jgi:hypothetical protein
MAFNWLLPVRIASLLFALIELGLTAYGMSCHFSCYVHMHSCPLHTSPLLHGRQPFNYSSKTNSRACYLVVHFSDDYFYEDPYGDWGVNGTSIWSLLALIYLAFISPPLGSGSPIDRPTGTFSRHTTSKHAVLAIDAVTGIFWLAGWIALAKLIGGPSTCTKFCAAIQASVAFAAFLWALFMGTALYDVWLAWRVRGSPQSKTPQRQATF